MIRLRVKVKSESTIYAQTFFLPDDYVISKQNNDLMALVDKCCKSSNFQVIDEVKITSSFEW